MEFDGSAYSRSQLRRLARGTSDMAALVSGTDARYTTSVSAIRAAVGDDDYGRAYWQARGRRIDGIGTGLGLLASALGREETRLLRALKTYRAGDDASTPEA
ncbi:hypothetical protein HD597_003842 [Nonomuraea thailandensis]|uniref:Uncharacterized protein n=1 Tax=Nonomuraea thailandensis TaxID=1188745 RepID=A0A9X2GDH2_9ACTN|nr:hypothetical protein [Nonomuraea thailandensis]MCP2356822.1 hypothetical protein [Nonomuraea thailandensis]